MMEFINSGECQIGDWSFCSKTNNCFLDWSSSNWLRKAILCFISLKLKDGNHETQGCHQNIFRFEQNFSHVYSTFDILQLAQSRCMYVDVHKDLWHISDGLSAGSPARQLRGQKWPHLRKWSCSLHGECGRDMWRLLLLLGWSLSHICCCKCFTSPHSTNPLEVMLLI